jgi:hypothetical protein
LSFGLSFAAGLFEIGLFGRVLHVVLWLPIVEAEFNLATRVEEQ